METGLDMEQAASFRASETEKTPTKYKEFLKKWSKMLLPGALLFSTLASAEAQNQHFPTPVDLGNKRVSVANMELAKQRIPAKVDLRHPEAVPVPPAAPAEITGIPKTPEPKEQTTAQATHVYIRHPEAAPIAPAAPAEVPKIPTPPEARTAVSQTKDVNLARPDEARQLFNEDGKQN
jgi:hypothetical protein